MFDSAFIKKHFHLAVGSLNPPDISNELKHELLKGNHVMVNRFYQNLAKQLNDVQVSRRNKGKKPASLQDVVWMIHGLTKVFVTGIEVQAKRRIESELERLKREQEAQKTKDMESTIAGKPQGIFEEMGVVTDEKALGPERDKKADAPKAATSL